MHAPRGSAKSYRTPGKEVVDAQVGARTEAGSIADHSDARISILASEK